MKNVFKFFGMALVAGLMFTACTPQDPIDGGEVKYTVTVTANNADYGTVAGGGEYVEGTEITLTATPNDGYAFVNWNDNVTDNPRTVTVTGDVTYTANFEAVSAGGSFSASFDGQDLGAFQYVNGLTNGQLYLVQAAEHAEGTSVYFPYIVNYLQGTSAADMAILQSELYKDTYYSGTDPNTGQPFQYGDWQLFENTSINVTAFDATALTMSASFANVMYSLTEMVEGTATDESSATHKNLSCSFNNVAFEMASK